MQFSSVQFITTLNLLYHHGKPHETSYALTCRISQVNSKGDDGQTMPSHIALAATRMTSIPIPHSLWCVPNAIQCKSVTYQSCTQTSSQLPRPVFQKQAGILSRAPKCYGLKWCPTIPFPQRLESSLGPGLRKYACCYRGSSFLRSINCNPNFRGGKIPNRSSAWPRFCEVSSIVTASPLRRSLLAEEVGKLSLLGRVAPGPYAIDSDAGYRLEEVHDSLPSLGRALKVSSCVDLTRSQVALGAKLAPVLL